VLCCIDKALLRAIDHAFELRARGWLTFELADLDEVLELPFGHDSSQLLPQEGKSLGRAAIFSMTESLVLTLRCQLSPHG
jgi:hypothetical protein